MNRSRKNLIFPVIIIFLGEKESQLSVAHSEGGSGKRVSEC